MDKEYRSFDLVEVRIVDGKDPKIVGYAAVFDKMSEDMAGFREVIRKGAFTKTLKDKADVRALFNHDPNFVLGRSKSGTLALEEDEKGLRIEIDPPRTQIVNDLVIEPMRRGDIDQMSFGFRTVKDAWPQGEEGKTPVRELLEVKLFDISPVTFPAYPQTSVKVRGFDEGVLESIEKRYRSGGGLDAWDVAYIKRAIDILRGYLADGEPVHADHSADVAEPLHAGHSVDFLIKRLALADYEI